MYSKLLVSLLLCVSLFSKISKSSVIDLEDIFEEAEGYKNETQVLETSTLLSLPSSDASNPPEPTELVPDSTGATETPTTEKIEDISKATTAQETSTGATRPRRQDPLRRFIPKHRVESPSPKKYAKTSTLFEMCPQLGTTCPACSVPQNQLSHYICYYPVVLKVLILSPPETDSSGRMCGKLGKLSVHGATESKQFRSLLRFSVKDTCGCHLKVSQHYLLFTLLSEFTKQGRVYSKVSLSHQSLLVPVDQHTEPDILQGLSSCSSVQGVGSTPNAQDPQQPLLPDSSYDPRYMQPILQPVPHDSLQQQIPSHDSTQRASSRSARDPHGPRSALQPNSFFPPPAKPSPAQYPFVSYPTLPPMPSLRPLPPLQPLPNMVPFPQMTPLPGFYIPPLVYNPSQPGVQKSITYSTTNQGQRVNVHTSVQYNSTPRPIPAEHSEMAPPPRPAFSDDRSPPAAFVPYVDQFPEYSSSATQVSYMSNNVAPTNVPNVQMVPFYPPPQQQVPPLLPYPAYPPYNHQNPALHYVNSNSSFSSSFSSTVSRQPQLQQSYTSPLSNCLHQSLSCPCCFPYNATMFRDAYCTSNYAFLSTITFPDRSTSQNAQGSEYGNGQCLNLRAQLLHDISKNVGAQNLYQSLSLLLPNGCNCLEHLKGPAVIFFIGYDSQQPQPPQTQLTGHHDLFLVPTSSETTLPNCQSYQAPVARDEGKSADFSHSHAQYESGVYPDSPPTPMQYPIPAPSQAPEVEEYSSLMPPVTPDRRAAEENLVYLPEPTSYSDNKVPHHEPTGYQESSSSSYEEMNQPTPALTKTDVSYPTSEPLAPISYEEVKNIASESLQINPDHVNYPAPPANYEVAEGPPQPLLNSASEPSTFETFKNPNQPQQPYRAENYATPVPQTIYDAAKYPAQQQYFEAANNPAPPQQQPYRVAYNPAPPQQQFYEAENNPAPPQQQPYGVAYNPAPPQHQLYEASNNPAPPQQQPHVAANYPAPETYIQEYEAGVCPTNIVDSCPSHYSTYDESHLFDYCKAPYGIIVEFQGPGLQRPSYTFPLISVKTTSSVKEKKVVVSVSGPPPLSCSQRSVKVIKNIGTQPHHFQEGSTIPIVFVSNCNFYFASINRVNRLLLYSFTTPNYLPNGGIQMTNDINVASLDPYQSLPNCLASRPIYVSRPGYQQPPTQIPQRKHEYPPSPTPPTYIPPPIYKNTINTPPPVVYRPSIHIPPPSPPEYKPTGYTPPPVYKNTVNTLPPIVYRPSGITPTSVYPEYRPLAYTPPPQVYRPSVHTPPPTPPEYNPLAYTPPLIYKQPFVPPMPLNRPVVYTSPPAYRPQVNTPPPPPYVHQQRPTQQPTHVPPNQYGYTQSQISSITVCPKPEQPLSCPMYEKALPSNFHQLYCMSQFAMVVAIGVDKDPKYITEKEKPRILPFRKPKRSTLEDIYDDSLYAYNITVTHGKKAERRINNAAYASSGTALCHREQVLGLYDVSPERTAHEYMVDFDLYVQIPCDSSAFDRSPAYGILMSVRPPDLTGPIQLSQDFAFFPLPEGKLTLPTCSLPPHIALNYEDAPYKVTHYVPPALYGHRMEVSCTNDTCGTCSFMRPKNGFNVPCDMQFVALVEILETSAELNVAPSLDVQHLLSKEHVPGIVLNVKSNVDQQRFAKTPSYESNPSAHYSDNVKCRYAKVRVVKDLSPSSTYPTRDKELTLIIPVNCDCHLFDVDSGFAILLTKFQVMSNVVVPITGDFSKVICLPTDSVTIATCPTAAHANWLYNIPNAQNPTNRQFSYSFSYSQTPVPYVHVPNQYTPHPVSFSTTPGQYSTPSVSHSTTPTPYVPAHVPYQPAPTPYVPAPVSYTTNPDPYAHAPAPYSTSPVSYSQTYAPAPAQDSYAPAAASYEPAPAQDSYAPAAASYEPAPALVSYESTSAPFAPTQESYAPSPFLKPYAPTDASYIHAPAPVSYTSTPAPHRPTHVPYAPTHVPYAPTHVPYAPTHVPYAPTHVPYAPTHVPYAPTEAPYAPTEAPYAPTEAPYALTHAPYAPTHAQYAPTHAQYAPTHAPYAPTHAQYAPTHAPYAPTHAPYAPEPPSKSYAPAPAPEPYALAPEPQAPAPASYEPARAPHTRVPEPYVSPPEETYYPSPTPYKTAPDQYSTPQAQYPTAVPYTHARTSYTSASVAYPVPQVPDASKFSPEPYAHEVSANVYQHPTTPITYAPNVKNFSVGSMHVPHVPKHPPFCTDPKKATQQDCPVCDEIRCIKPEVYCNSKLAVIARPNGVYKDESVQASGNIISLYDISSHKPAQRAVSNILYKLPKQCSCPMLEENRFLVVLIEDEMSLMTPAIVNLDEGDYVYSTFTGRVTLPSCSSDQPRTGNMPEEIILPPVLDSELPRTPQPSMCPDLDHSCPRCEGVDDNELKNLVCSSDNTYLVSIDDAFLNASTNVWKEHVTVSQHIAQNYSIGIEIKPHKYENRCNLPELPGDCNAYTNRFHYDANEEVCYGFDYSGCNGNANNFLTEEECEETCMKNDNCDKGSLHVHKVVRGASTEGGQSNAFQYVLPEHCDCPQLATGEFGYLVFNTSSSEAKIPTQFNQNYFLLRLSDPQRKFEIICDEGDTNYGEIGASNITDTEKSVPEITTEVNPPVTTTKKSGWFG